jgi:imidazolonepropionase-like amidohydrolase
MLTWRLDKGGTMLSSVNGKPHLAILLLVVLLATSATIASAQQVARHEFLTVGEKSGEQVVTRGSDGSLTIRFKFNDRGRGPDTVTQLALDDRGLPADISISGVNYAKAEIQETYSRKGSAGTWESEIERGSSGQADTSFFWPANGPPELMAILARALLHDDDGQVPVLPSGTARIETLDGQTVSNAAGEEKRITLHAIHGLGDSPSYVWLDSELNLFGADYGWFAITPEGWAESFQVMKQVQDADEGGRLIEASERLQTELSGLVAFTDVDVFDSLNGTLAEGKTVYVMDGVVTSVVDAAEPVSEEAQLVDGSGKTMVPGLWDMHGHVSPTNYFNYLALGVTNVRDMANDPEFIIKTRRDIRSGALAGPDIHALGFIDKDTEFAAPTGMLADTLEEAISLVDYYARHGFVGIKLYSSVEPQWVAPIADHAHALGLTVQGHVPAYMLATNAIEDGFDELTHINMAMLDLLNADDVDTRTPLRFTVPGSQGGSIDVNGAAMNDLVAVMKANGTAIDPTLGIFLDMFLNEPGAFQVSHAATADHYPPGVRRASLASRGRNYGDESKYAKAAATARSMVKRFFDEGITVLAGTDNAPWGFALLYELRAYVEAGIPEADVLRMATIVAARHMGMDQTLGSISPGKRAHFVLIDGNPLDDIGALVRTRIVVKDQFMYSATDLLREQGYVPFD